MNTAEEKTVRQKILLGSQQLGLTITTDKIDIFIGFIETLLKWNKAYNLTSLHDTESIVTKHILDSLSIIPFIKGKKILDVGTGAGFPGLPIAIVRPDVRLVLLDSNGKKTRFLTYAVGFLKIKNVEIVQQRVERYLIDEKFTSVIVRAFSSIENIIDKTKHLLAPDGRLLIMKGSFPASELEKISQNVKVYPLLVPGLEEQRHLVCIEGNARE